MSKPPFEEAFEQEARLALAELNIRIAAIFGKQLIVPTIQFVPLIDRREVLLESGKIAVTREVLGTCDRERGRIRLVPKQGWQDTAVHEFVHLYNPHRREKTIKDITLKVILFLKGLGPQPTNSRKEIVDLLAWSQGTQGWQSTPTTEDKPRG